MKKTRQGEKAKRLSRHACVKSGEAATQQSLFLAQQGQSTKCENDKKSKEQQQAAVSTAREMAKGLPVIPAPKGLRETTCDAMRLHNGKKEGEERGEKKSPQINQSYERDRTTKTPSEASITSTKKKFRFSERFFIIFFGNGGNMH